MRGIDKHAGSRLIGEPHLVGSGNMALLRRRVHLRHIHPHAVRQDPILAVALGPSNQEANQSRKPSKREILHAYSPGRFFQPTSLCRSNMNGTKGSALRSRPKRARLSDHRPQVSLPSPYHGQWRPLRAPRREHIDWCGNDSTGCALASWPQGARQARSAPPRGLLKTGALSSGLSPLRHTFRVGSTSVRHRKRSSPAHRSGATMHSRLATIALPWPSASDATTGPGM